MTVNRLESRYPTWIQLFARHLGTGRTAILLDGRRYDFDDLAKLATAASRWLDEAGAPPGAAVPALLTTTADALALAIAGTGSDRPLAPFNPRLTLRELRACVGPLDSPVIVAEPSSTEVASALATELHRRVAVLDGLAPAPSIDLDFDRPGDATAVVLHTSGTTGIPKRVDIPQHKLMLRAVRQGTVMGLGPGTTFAVASSFHHIAGLGTLFIAMGMGSAVIPCPPFTPDVWRSLAAYEPTHAVLIPAMVERLLDEGALHLPSLRVIVYGSSPMRPDTIRRALEALPGVDIYNMYGQTEGSPLTFLSGDDHRRAVAENRPDLLLSVGRPFAGVELRIDRPDDTGAGELVARAEHMFRVNHDGCLHTGDLARIDDEGYVYLVGRKGDLIIRGGENVYPAEVEGVLNEHPGVREAAVVGVPDDRLGQTVHAVVIASDSANPPSFDELRTFARERLAGFKVPASWMLAHELPRNTMGKLLRNQLPLSSSEAR
ncbi:MAG: class I adenylate-forming enzyme family protein [Acidimicrobiia bacterium]